MIALLGLSAFARADVALEACELATLSQTLPAPDATDVPLNTVPLLVFHGSCGLDTPYTAIARVDGVVVAERVLDFAAFQPAGVDWLVDLDLGPLQASTRHEIELTSNFGEARSFAFTTGTNDAPPVTGVPAIELLDAIDAKGAFQGERITEVELAITPASARGALLIVREGGVERAAITQPGAGPFDELVSWAVYDRQREVCVSVLERDPTGAWHGPSDELCAPVNGRGCSHVNGLPLVLGLLPLAAVRRRRERT